MLGDFSKVLSIGEKYGGNQINLNRALEFKECLDNCNFLDLGFASGLPRPIRGLSQALFLEGLIDVLLILAGECYILKLL